MKFDVYARRIFAVFCVLGVCVGVVMMRVSWQHNPQGEFHDDTGVRWLSWLGVGFGWFITIAGLPALVALTVTILSRVKRR